MIDKTICLRAIVADGAVIEINVLRDTELNTDAELDHSGYAVGKFLQSISSAMFMSGLRLATKEFTKITCRQALLEAEGAGESEVKNGDK